MEKLQVDKIASVCSGKIICGDKNTAIKGVSIDSRTTEPGEAFFALVGFETDGHRYINHAYEKGSRVFIVSDPAYIKESPDVVFILVEDTLKALQDLASWYASRFDMKKIAVTGSIGKTTTRDMIYSIIRRRYRVGASQRNMNSETGLPLTLFTFDKEMTHAVVEMGMDGPGQITELVEIFQPDIAVITNIGITHIEKLGSRDNIFKAKMEITKGMGKDNILVVNNDDDKLRTLKQQDLPYKVITAGTSPDSDFIVSDIEDLGESGVRFSLTSSEGTMPIRLSIPGAHNAINAALAAATASSIGISMEDITAGLARTETTGNRLKIFTAGNVKIIDDSYNAAPQSVKSAINTLMKSEGERKVAIIGDMNELGEKSPELHEDIGKCAVKAGVDELISIGSKALKITEGAKKTEGDVIIKHFDKKEDMYPHIRECIREGDTVLIKGSRSIELEDLADKIKETFV